MEEKTVCFLINDNPDREILLGYKKVRFGAGNTGFGAGKYAGIGGSVESGETIRRPLSES